MTEPAGTQQQESGTEQQGTPESRQAAGAGEQQTKTGEDSGASGSLIGKAVGDGGASGGEGSNTGQPGVGNGQPELIGAPDGYGVYSVPEGIQLNVETAKELNDMAKSMNLSQVGAQKLVDLHVKHSQKQNDAAQAQFHELKNDWEKETKKELGADYNTEMVLVSKTV